MLMKNGPPVEAANVVRYDADTHENIYSHFQAPPVHHQPPPPRVPREREVPLHPEPKGKENIEENQEKKAAVPKERGKLAPRTQKNFLKANKTAKLETRTKQAKEEESKH